MEKDQYEPISPKPVNTMGDTIPTRTGAGTATEEPKGGAQRGTHSESERG